MGLIAAIEIPTDPRLRRKLKLQVAAADRSCLRIHGNSKRFSEEVCRMMKTIIYVLAVAAVSMCNGCTRLVFQRPAYYQLLANYLGRPTHKAVAICLSTMDLVAVFGEDTVERAKVTALNRCSLMNPNAGDTVLSPLRSTLLCNDCQLTYVDDEEMFDPAKYYELRDAQGQAESAALFGAMTKLGVTAAAVALHKPLPSSDQSYPPTHAD
jgi:hypothetical protein